MNAKGAKTIRSLGRVFNTWCANGHRKVDAQEFFVGLNECGCRLTKEETNCLLAHLDTDADGHVNYDAFLTSLRGKVNDTRQRAICAAFNKFDINGSGSITAADLKPVYNVSCHPRVMSGEITADEAFLEFLANFADRDNNGRISKCEWNDFYAAVSLSIDNDDHFCELMKSSWQLAC